MKSDVFCFEVGGKVHKLECSSYESKMISRLCSGEASQLFRSIKHGHVVETPAKVLLDAAKRLYQFLEANRAVLEYRYGINAINTAGVQEYTGGGGFGCRLNGELAIAEAGPGYCRITAVQKEPATRANIVLKDMTDMKRIIVDNGWTLIPTRKRRPVELESRLAPLIQFLNAHSESLIAQRLC